MKPLFGQLYMVLNWSLVCVFYSINFANLIKNGGKPNDTMMLRMCLEINDDPDIDNKVEIFDTIMCFFYFSISYFVLKKQLMKTKYNFLLPLQHLAFIVLVLECYDKPDTFHISCVTDCCGDVYFSNVFCEETK